MEDLRPQAESRGSPVSAGADRPAHFRAARRLIFLILALCLPAAGQTADPYGDLLDRQFAAPSEAAASGAGPDPDKMTAADWRVFDLESAIKLEAQKIARTPRIAPPPPSQTGLVLAAALPLAALLALVTLGCVLLKQRFDAWMAARAAAGENVLDLIAEDPSLEAFFIDLRDGLAASTVHHTLEVAGALNGVLARTNPDASGAEVGPLQEFFDTAPRRLAGLRTLFSDLGRATNDADRQRISLDFFDQVRSLKESSRLPALHLVWLMASALEGLAKQLSSEASKFTPSAQRTAAGAVDLLESLCVRGLNPNLANEPPVRILAVDDDPVSRLAMSFALKRVFNEPHLAPDGAAGLALAVGQTYDVIFLDVEMPGMDGFELCAKIHETVRNRMTPVVFVTHHNDFNSRAKSALSGGQDLIAKPYLAFEITVKALTLALRARLKHGSPQARSVRKATAAKTAPGQAAMAVEASAALIPSVAPAPGAGTQQQKRGLSQPDTGTSPTAARPSAPGPSSDPSTPGRSSWELSDRGFQALFSRNDSPESFFTRSPARFEELHKRLQAALHAARPADVQECLGELFLGVHSLSLEAERAERRTVFRLSSALEGMLKKLLEHSRLCTPSALSTAAAALELLEELCHHTGTQPDFTNPPIRMLVVDDDPVARRAMSLSTQLVFGRPDNAESGEAALGLAAEQPYDLIFLDVLMPGMDGFATCQQIHETALNRRTPVMFVTGHDDREARSRAGEAGGCGFIPKPVLASQITVTALTHILRARLNPSKPDPARQPAADLEIA